MIRPFTCSLFVLTALTLTGCCCGCCAKNACPAPKAPAQAEAPAAKLDGKWLLADLPAAKAKKVTVPDGIFILFEKSRAVGFSGVNRFFGDFTTSAQSLKFERMGVTRMAGPHMDAEDLFLQALNTTVSYRIDAGTLSFLDASGAVVATFKRTSNDK